MATKNPAQIFIDGTNEGQVSYLKSKLGLSRPVDIKQKPVNPNTWGAYDAKYQPGRGVVDKVEFHGQMPYNPNVPTTAAHEYGLHGGDDVAGINRWRKQYMAPLKERLTSSNLPEAEFQRLWDEYTMKQSVVGHQPDWRQLPEGTPSRNNPAWLSRENQVLDAFDVRGNALERGNVLEAYPGAGKWGKYEKIPAVDKALKERGPNKLLNSKYKGIPGRLPAVFNVLGMYPQISQFLNEQSMSPDMKQRQSDYIRTNPTNAAMSAFWGIPPEAFGDNAT